MSSKIGLLISLIFFALFFTLSIDVLALQYQFSDLDAKSVYISYELSRMEVIDEKNIKELEDKYHVFIVDISNKTPLFGDVVEFTILKTYHPLIISNEDMEIKINRSTVIGYY